MEIKQTATNWLMQRGLDEHMAGYAAAACLALAILILSYFADVLAKRILLSAVSIAVRKSQSKWDDVLLERKVFSRLAHLAPALVVYVASPLAFAGWPILVTFFRNASFIYMILVTLLAGNSFLDSVHDIYKTTKAAKHIPIKGFLQAAKLIFIFVGFILVLSAATDKTPLYFLSGLGALTAVLLLIFRDAILGFVAGIQLSANDMVTTGDWIEMPQFGADGYVTDVTLTTVKVQNWDKTITTIPTYSLISQSFRNWRGMMESGGRRIKRAIYIDMGSIRFCDEEMIERFAGIQYIRDYLDRKKEEIAQWNRERHLEDASLINRRRLTNVGTFRAYVNAYLRNHPMVRQDMTFLVRHLAPTEHGLPLEIYVFCADQAWASYESIQADIFDHLLAAAPEFDLRIYQAPSGADFRGFVK